MSRFDETIVRDLREFAATLLEPGASATSDAVRLPALDTYSGLLTSADLILSLLPGLLRQVGRYDPGSPMDVEWTRRPGRGRPDKTAGGWTVVSDVWVPRFWPRESLTVVPRPEPLEWLLWRFGELRTLIELRSSELRDQLEEVKTATFVDSEYAQADQSKVEELLAALESAVKRLDGGVRTVRATSDGRLRPRPIPPRPYPRGRAWAILRRVCILWDHPARDLPHRLAALFDTPTPLADLPTLYQRWCALQLYESLRRLGGKVRRGSPPLATFIGGNVTFSVPGGATLSVWIEPRIGRGGHGCGLVTSKVREQCPDFVLIHEYRGRCDAFILDATLSSRQDILAAKARYLLTLQFPDLRLIAGVSVAKPPLRAWAVYPSPINYCVLRDPEGRTGNIPLDPTRCQTEPLDAWLGDLLRL